MEGVAAVVSAARCWPRPPFFIQYCCLFHDYVQYCCLFHDCLPGCLSVLTVVSVCDRVEIT